MSDLQILGLVLLVVYFWECLVWLRRDELAFTTWRGCRWRIRHAGNLMASQSGGFVLAPPIPPLGTILVSSLHPFSLSREAVFSWVPFSLFGWRVPQTGRFVRWSQVRDVSVKGRRVCLNGRSLACLSSPFLARQWAENLAALNRSDATGREEAIQQILRKQFDLDGVRRRWREFSCETRGLRWLVNGLFLYIMAFGPLVIGGWGIRGTWPFLVAGLLVITGTTAWLGRRAHQRLYPEAGEERFVLFLTTLLSPPTAVRVLDALARPLLGAYHPLAVAAVFCSQEKFRVLAQTVLLDARFPVLPVCPTEEEFPQRVEHESRKRFLSLLEEFLKSQGVDPAELVKAPVRSETGCVAYCPRCLAQFTAGAGRCPDCGGIALLPL